MSGLGHEPHVEGGEGGAQRQLETCQRQREETAAKSEECSDGHLRRDTTPHAKMMRLNSEEENIFGPQLNFVHG